MTAAHTFAGDGAFKWPDGKKAAVCLTFDDGLDCHLDVAVPLLDEFRMKGTFYCTGNSTSLHERRPQWRAITGNGHELGNHSLFHPCDGRKHDWVKPEYDLNNYTMDRIQSELYTANTLLEAVDNSPERTYGYTCDDFKVAGDTPFIDVVRELFVAARNGGPMPTSMDDVDIHFMPGWGPVDNSGADLINYVKQAREHGTIAIFVFHSVGGGYLNTSAEAFRELLVYLKENEQDFWVDTFYNVTKHIDGTRG